MQPIVEMKTVLLHKAPYLERTRRPAVAKIADRTGCQWP